LTVSGIRNTALSERHASLQYALGTRGGEGTAVNTSGWRRRVDREWGQLTGGPVSATWWLVRALLRVAFMEAVFMLLAFLAFRPDVLAGVVAGTASWWAVLAAVATTPVLLGAFLLVGVLALVAPFLPRRNPAYPGSWR
jgi:hypothetical protein